MRTSRSSVVLPIPVRRALRKLGHDIRDARRRRRIPVAIAAQRASISRTTLVKIEKGDPGVAIGSYATVLFVIGMAAVSYTHLRAPRLGMISYAVFCLKKKNK